EVVQRTVPPHLEVGTRIIRPLGARMDMGSLGATSEEIALAFVRYMQQGRGAEALAQLANSEAVLCNAFPIQAKGLTTYSKGLAGRSLMRILSLALNHSPSIAL